MPPFRKSKSKRPAPAFTTCPNCDASFRAGRLACPECGSDAETGWRDSEEIDELAVDLPEPDDGPLPPAETFGLPRWLVISLAVVLLIALVLGARRLF